MKRARTGLALLLAIPASLIIGAAAGVLFGERSIPESETAVVLRASQIVDSMLEWLPDETAPDDIVYDGIHGMLEILDPHSNYLDPRSFQRMRSRQEGSFFGVGIIIDRALYIRMNYSVDANEFMNRIRKLVQAGNIDRAIRQCEAKAIPLLEVVKSGPTTMTIDSRRFRKGPGTPFPSLLRPRRARSAS